MRYVGLDAHLRQSTFYVLDDQGRKIMTRTVKGTSAAVVAELKRVTSPFAVCFEASAGYGVLFERLRLLARRVVVAHPGQLRLIFRSKRKNDRVDAEKLAKLLFLDEVPAVYVPSGSTQAWRRMVEHRHKLVGERTRAKNGLRALLRSLGIDAPKGLWSRRGLAWLAAVDLPTGLDTLQRDILQELLALTDADAAPRGDRTGANRRRAPGRSALDDDPRHRDPDGRGRHGVYRQSAAIPPGQSGRPLLWDRAESGRFGAVEPAGTHHARGPLGGTTFGRRGRLAGHPPFAAHSSILRAGPSK